MQVLLAILTGIAYMFGWYALLLMKSDIQLIAAGVYFTCGTVALSGFAVLRELQKRPTPL